MRYSGKGFSGAIMTLLAAGFLASGCSGTEEVEMLDYSGGTNVGMPNPFTSYNTLEEAEQVVGFSAGRSFVPPANWNKPPLVQVLDSYPDRKKMLQVIYVDDAQRNLYLRYSRQFTTREMNGDYNSYPVEKDIDINGQDVHVRGDRKGYYNAEFFCRGVSVTVLSDLPLGEKDLATVCTAK